MENIRGSFENVKQDINLLKDNFFNLEIEFSKINNRLLDFTKIIENLYNEIFLLKSSYNNLNEKLDNFKRIQTENNSFQTDRQKYQTDNSYFKPLNTQILGISIGNKGVSTDRQTNRQTDRQKNIFQNSSEKRDIDEAEEIIGSLSNIKDNLQLKFKSLTDQEILVFSAIYQLDEEQGYSNYKILSSRLNLSESSIRDYVSRLIKKDIPLDKEKVNNKEIILKISPNLKKIASLTSILNLKDQPFRR